MAPVTWRYPHTGKAYNSPAAYRAVVEGEPVTAATLTEHFSNLTAEKVTPTWESQLSDYIVRLTVDFNVTSGITGIADNIHQAIGGNASAHIDALLVSIIEQRTIRCALSAESDRQNAGFTDKPFEGPQGNTEALHRLAAWARSRAYAECVNMRMNNNTWSQFVQGSDEAVKTDYLHCHMLNTTWHSQLDSDSFDPALGAPLDPEREDSPPRLQSALLLTLTVQTPWQSVARHLPLGFCPKPHTF